MRQFERKMVLALLLALLPASPGWAAFDAGGSVAVDYFYYAQDKAGFGGGRAQDMATPTTGGYAGINEDWPTVEEDRSATFFSFSKTSFLWFRWTSEANLGLMVQPVLAGDAAEGTGTNSLKVAFVSAFGWYRITPKLTLYAGKGAPDIFSPLDPTTYLGYDAVGKVTGLGYGNINSKYQNGIQVKYTFGTSVTLNFGLYESRFMDPNNENFTSFAHYIGFKKSSPDAIVDNVTKLPKIELSVPLQWGGTRIISSAMYLRQEFDNIAEGADDTITTYGVALGAETGLGIFKFKCEINYGQNWYNATKINVNTSYPFKSEYVPALGWAQSAAGALLGTDGKLYDSTDMAFWLQAGVKLGRFEPTIFYGRQTAKRDIPTQEVDVTTQMYGLNCPIQITKQLKLTPEIMIYDNGDSNRFLHPIRASEAFYFNSDVYDCGKEVLIGTQLRWTF